MSNEDKIEELKKMIEQQYAGFTNFEEPASEAPQEIPQELPDEYPEENFKGFENVNDGMDDFQEFFKKEAEEMEQENLSSVEEVSELIEENNKNETIEETENIIQETETIEEQATQELEEQLPPPPKEELSSVWEEYDKNNAVVKKYIVNVAKENVPYIDRLSVEQRNNFINEAIQIKLEVDNEQEKLDKKKNLAKHMLLFILTFFIVMTFMILIIDKAIVATMENYKYSQENFEKLYKHRFEKQKAFYTAVQSRNNRTYTRKVD